MSIRILKNEIDRFLASDTPEVICIKGKWGIGKTYSWNKFIRDAASIGKVSLENYCYVSLFGLKNLSDLRYAVFEGTIPVSQIGRQQSESYWAKKYDEAVKNYRKIGSFLSRHPKIQSYIGVSESALFFSVKKQIVCIDDLERSGSGLGVGDVLGLVSMMKEQRGCKIVILLNDQELAAIDKKIFDRQLEKVADVVFDFNPTPEEVGDIAFPEKTGSLKYLHYNCSKLGIVNIRIIKKIEHFATRIDEIIGKQYPQLVEESMHSLVLFCWSVYQPSEAPSVDFLQSYNSFAFSMKEKDLSREELSWHSLLSNYRFNSFNELDKEILLGVSAGYFDESSLKLVAAQYSAWQQAKADDTNFHEAWEMYHHSFDDNQEEFGDAIFSSTLKILKTIHPANLNSSIVLLRDIGRSAQATLLIKQYVEANPKMIDTYDPSARAFWDIKDAELIAVLTSHQPTKLVVRNLLAILLDAASNIHPSDEDYQMLEKSSVQEIIDLFKATKGDDKRMMLKAVNAYINWQEQDDKFKKIVLKLLNALKIIGEESPLNGRRVRQFVDIPEDLPPC